MQQDHKFPDQKPQASSPIDQNPFRRHNTARSPKLVPKCHFGRNYRLTASNCPVNLVFWHRRTPHRTDRNSLKFQGDLNPRLIHTFLGQKLAKTMPEADNLRPKKRRNSNNPRLQQGHSNLPRKR